MYNCIILCYFYTEPKLKDLSNYVTSQYGIHWKKIGTHLGVDDHQLLVIENDSSGDTTRQCNNMFIRWLQKDTSPTWEKFFKAFDLAMQSASKWLTSQFLLSFTCINNAKQKHLGCKKVRGQSEATLLTGRRDQKV